MIRRIIKIVMSIIGLLIVAVVIVIAGSYVLITRIDSVSVEAVLTDLPLNIWTRIDLSDETQCGDGSDYHIYVRRAASDNLIIHFAGGGMAWDANSASKPITLTGPPGFYFASIMEIRRITWDGIANHRNTDNPFADWNHIFIAYCTGDFHIGNTSITYPLDDGQSLTIHHSGYVNVTAALDWIYSTFLNPPKLLVSGESAGAFASTFWVPIIADHYSNSETYNLSDSAYLQTSQWPHIVNEVWLANSEKIFGFAPTDNLINSAYLAQTQRSTSSITYLQFNTLYDGVLTYYDSVLNNQREDNAYAENWSQRMRASISQIAASNLDYNYYLTDYGRDPQNHSTPHTSVSQAHFYEVKQDNARLVDWVRRIVLGDERFSIGSEFLP